MSGFTLVSGGGFVDDWLFWMDWRVGFAVGRRWIASCCVFRFFVFR